MSHRAPAQCPHGFSKNPDSLAWWCQPLWGSGPSQASPLEAAGTLHPNHANPQPWGASKPAVGPGQSPSRPPSCEMAFMAPPHRTLTSVRAMVRCHSSLGARIASHLRAWSAAHSMGTQPWSLLGRMQAGRAGGLQGLGQARSWLFHFKDNLPSFCLKKKSLHITGQNLLGGRGKTRWGSE